MEDADDVLLSRVLNNVHHVLHPLLPDRNQHGYMNCDAGATIALSLLLTTNATLFTDKHTNTVTKRFPYTLLLV